MGDVSRETPNADGLWPGAVAVDHDGFVWQLWTFDGRPGAPLMWWKLPPVLVNGGFGAPIPGRDRYDVPGTVVHTGTLQRHP